MVQEEHVVDLLAAYALDCLDVDEKIQVDAHISECQQCRAELQTYQDIVEVLPLAMQENTPPSGLKGQILRSARQSQTRPVAQTRASWWEQLAGYLRQTAPAWGLASLVLILLLGVNNLFLWQRVNQIESHSQAPFMSVTMTGTEASPDASGLLVISRDGEHGTLIVDGLAALDPTSQYQLWLIRDGQRTNGGVFSVDQEGYGSLWISSPRPLASYASFGITVEPAGGSPGPTGEKVLGGDL